MTAHELSNKPEREDRPASAAEARFDAYLEQLAADTPRAGLAAPSGAFIDDLIARTQRYRDHLFVCFDDSRIPATTNELERFFGSIKATLRRTMGAKSTTNSVVANLGADLLITYHQFRRRSCLDGSATRTTRPYARRGDRGHDGRGAPRGPIAFGFRGEVRAEE